MATTIKLKNSVTTTNAPTSLVQGEVAINITDKKVWVGNAATTPVLLLGSGADGTFTNLTVSGVASFADGTVSLPSITNIGDTNTGIFFPAADTIAFTEGGVESMRIDSSANVGIGTSSPASKLDVRSDSVDSIFWGNAAASIRGIATFSGSTVVLGSGTVSPVVFAINSVEKMRMDTSGNVGIGTLSPAGASGKNLTIYNSAGQSRLAFKNSVTGDGANDGFQVGIDGDGMALVEQRENLAMTFSTNATERMRITAGGLLYVGTTTNLQASERMIVLDATGNTVLFTKTEGGSGTWVQKIWNNATSGTTNLIEFLTETTITSRGSITYNRGAGLTAYNTTSDYRAKDIDGLLLNSGEVIDSIPVYMGKMKGATQARPMFIAHETPDYAHTGEKDAVDKDGNPVYQQMDASSLVPVLWAEIQSLRKRIAALESK
jgi:hypothetical protein